jgi:putative ABC transport system substrate-binding protein
MDPTRLPHAPYGPRFGDGIRQEPSMERRTFVALVLGGLLAVPLAAEGQPVTKVYRLGILTVQSRQRAPLYRLLPQALRELGYVEGQNLVIEWRFAEGHVARLPELAADLVRLNVDVILAAFMPEILAAKQATNSIPIVMVSSVDPVGNGLVASLSRPGANITGMAIQPPEFGGKQVELIKQAVPSLSRLAVVWDPLYPGFMAFYKHAETAARVLGITLQSIEVQQASDFEAAFARLAKERPNGLAVWPTNIIGVQNARIQSFAEQNRLPIIYPTKAFMDTGGLISYGVNVDEQFRRVATYVDRVLKGAKPADLPVEQPTKFELVINLKTAKTLGLTIPPSLLGRADEVIQ